MGVSFRFPTESVPKLTPELSTPERDWTAFSLARVELDTGLSSVGLGATNGAPVAEIVGPGSIALLRYGVSASERSLEPEEMSRKFST